MRHLTVVAILVGSLCPTAKAYFELSSHVQYGNPYDVYTFQAVDRGTDTGTNILLLDGTLQAFSPTPNFDPRALPTPNGHLIMKAYDAQGNQPPRIDDLDVSNLTDVSPTDRSYIRAGPADQWAIVYTSPPYLSPDDPGPANLNGVPWADTTLSQFEVVASAGNARGGVPDTTPQTIAVAVVPSGEWVNFTGSIAGEVGNLQQFPVSLFVPEPSCLAVVLSAAAGLCIRRRRPARAG